HLPVLPRLPLRPPPPTHPRPPLSFFFYRPPAPRPLHSSPTRRSSDLGAKVPDIAAGLAPGIAQVAAAGYRSPASLPDDQHPAVRSEEHTSELQSLTNLVCRLLLEKKKKKQKPTTTTEHSTIVPNSPEP